ncbi:MAG: flagellar basal body L-ring protein FlgH [Rhodoferax sp.]|nr:flagellar basal body L-ring protein FlgH [Rhodoferax sp.]
MLWCSLAALLLASCAQVPREPLVQQPMTARPEAVRQPPPGAASHGSIYQAGYSVQPLFEDRRPRQVGDILTVQVRENVNASKNSAANVSRTGSASATLDLIPSVLGGLFAGDQSADVSGQNTMKASGGANAANTFNGMITVTIVDVLANGNLLVSGEKQMLINQGTEFIRFSGVVNPRTVGANNAVLSTQVADARIEYSAKGYIDEAQTMGWLQRFFLNVLPM